MTPGDDAAISEDLPNYSRQSGASEETPADRKTDDSIFDDAAEERPEQTIAQEVTYPADRNRGKLHAIVDELFPADPAHEVHARPLMDRVREALHRMADEI